MKRRDFLKGVLFAAALSSPVRVFALQDDRAEGEDAGPADSDFFRWINRDNPSGLEQKHVPAVGAPAKAGKGEWFDVAVNVGFMEEHPSAADHWITSVQLLLDGRAVARMDYAVGGVSASGALFRIRLEKTSRIEALETCNLHGTWISDPVTVVV